MKKGIIAALIICAGILTKAWTIAGEESGSKSLWLDIENGIIGGERAEYTIIIPRRWSAFLKAERGAGDMDKGIQERILFYYSPSDERQEPVFLLSVIVQDANIGKGIDNARKVYETNLYIFWIRAAEANPYRNVTDRGIFGQFLEDAEDTEMISGFISVPLTQWEVHYNTIKVNGRRLSGQVIIKDNNMVYLPLREVCEELGYKVTWHGIDQTITIERGMYFDVMTLDKNAKIKQSYEIYIENGICYVPAVYFIKNLSVDIMDIDENNNVFLSEKQE